MKEDYLRDEIAFIRQAIEEGRGWAAARGSDFVVWGTALAVGYTGTYALLKLGGSFDRYWLWSACIALPWIYVFRWLLPAQWFGQLQHPPSQRPMAVALRMLWYACGIFLTIFWIATSVDGEIERGWFTAVTFGTLGVGFFASSYLCNLVWMRWIAIAWWIGATATYALRQRSEVMLLAATLMLLLMAGPGLALRGRQDRSGA